MQSVKANLKLKKDLKTTGKKLNKNFKNYNQNK